MSRKISQTAALLFFLLFFTSQLSAQELLEKAETYVFQNLESLGLVESDLEGWELQNKIYAPKQGLTHFYWKQTYRGIEIHAAILNLSIYDYGEVLTIGSSFEPNLQARVDGIANLDATQALAVAASQFDISLDDAYIISVSSDPDSKTVFNQGSFALEPVTARLVYVKSGDSMLLAWEVLIYLKDGSHWFSIKIDAENGNFLESKDLVLSCNFDPTLSSSNQMGIDFSATDLQFGLEQKTDKIQAPDSYRVYPLGIESPNHGSRTLEVNPADVLASPFGWHDTDGSDGAEYTITRGNNVHAQEDANGNNGTGFSPDGGLSLDFDFGIDFTQEIDQNAPVPNQSAAITNLFYWNNLIHDIFYQYGLNEASGNFQQNNYGRGGIGGDYILADAQDGSGLNNANFSTPPDGFNGRMQMFLWSGNSVNDLIVNSPAGIAGTYNMEVGAFGASAFDITQDLVIADDGSLNPSEACNPLTNGASLTGKIAVIDRGNCQFGTKCLNAQNVGAVGVIIVNNVAGAPITMAPGTDGASVTIPVVMVSQADGNAIKSEIAGGETVNARMMSTPAMDIDGDFDNGIIVHEYGHGISIRLTGGPATSSCLQNSEQAGEGWSDWFGLVLTHLPSHTRNTARGIGTYALGEPTSGLGIRTYPYSTDMSVNPHTYADIQNLSLSVPHGVGSVFAVMLYDLYWNLIDQYGYDADLYNGSGGNNIAIQLVLDGLKLQPCSPGFVDMRDAILAADQANYAGANQTLIWQTFARRGLGYSASQGSTFSRTDGSEAFDLPPSIFPIELGRILAHGYENFIRLDWETLWEQNNQGFEVERFSAISQRFEPVGWVNAFGDTDKGHNYNFIDTDVRVGSSYIYRLKQVDFDGQFSYSDQVTAKLNPYVNPDLILYPNPLKRQMLSLDVVGIELKNNLQVSIFDKLGRKVFYRSFKKEEVIPGLSFNVGDLSTGIYSVKVQTAGFNQIESLLID